MAAEPAAGARRHAHPEPTGHTETICNVPYLVKTNGAGYYVHVTQNAKRPYRRAAQTREHVLDVAARLFYAEGIHAVGIDRIAEEAGGTVTTLYRLLGSKAGLVTAYLRRADQEWFDRMAGVASPDELIRLFDQLDQEACEAGNRGCAFRMALAEYPSADSEVHCVALDNRQRTRARLRELAAAARAADPD